MAPRRGGNAGAGAEAASTGSGRNYFEPPPLKRMSPWMQDGSAHTDIIAGGVDESGLFKGVYVSGVHLMALMRTFQLSKVFMPCDVPTPVAYIGQSLSDGVPLIIVTRGCFGREMDYGAGPVRNDIQKTIWQTARDMRAEMPQILITVIDIPINLPSDMLQDCMQSPLNEYRELMYQDGTWYTPQVINAAPLGRWMAENSREKPVSKKKGKGEVAFNRKKFDWQDSARFYGNMWVLGWRPVMEARPAPEASRRSDLVFYPGATKPEPQPIKMPPSVAEAAFKKALAKAKDAADPAAMLAATKAYLEKASMRETETLQEATKACDEAGDLFKAKSDATEAFEAVKMKFKALVSMAKCEEAMKVASEAFASASTAVLKAEGLKLVVTCHQTLGDLDEAVKAATSGKADVAKMNDEVATCEALDTLINAHLAKGDAEGAVAAATEATSSKGKVEACAQMLLSTALMAKSAESDVPADAKAAAKDAAAAAKKAASLYQSQRMAKEQAGALKAAAASLIQGAEFAEAATVAKELQELGKEEKAMGLEYVAQALLGSPAATTGGVEELMTSAKSALAIYEELDNAEGKASTMQVVAKALVATDGDLDEAYRTAKSSAAGYKALNKTEQMCTSLLTAAKAAYKKGNFTSAFWDAKQVVSEGSGIVHEEAMVMVSQIMRHSEEVEKPLGVGGPVPVFSGDYVSFV